MADSFFDINKGITAKPQGSTPTNLTNGDFWYDSTSGFQFRQAGTTTGLGSGGSGGGSSVIWGTDSSGTENPPSSSYEFGQLVYLYSSGLSQIMETTIKVPTSYTSGKPISVKISLYSPSTSNTILLSATSYLIRKNTDAMSSTTNSRTTTNTALTNSIANQLREAVLDVSDSTGKINSVSVSAGDLIRVQLTRGTDTDTADIRFVPGSTEVTFT